MVCTASLKGAEWFYTADCRCRDTLTDFTG